MNKKVLLALSVLAEALFCGGCADEKTPFAFDKEQVAGPAVPVTVENLVGTWRTHRLYSEYHDLTAASPSLCSGYIRFSADSVAFCQDTVTDRPEYKGTVSYDSIGRNVIFMNMSNTLDPSDAMPEVRMEVTKLTGSQMAATWIHYDPGYVSQGGDDELLVEYTFKGGSLEPAFCKEGMTASAVAPVGVVIHSISQGPDDVIGNDPDLIGVTGWGSNVNEGNARNVNFRLACPDKSYVIRVDSLSFIGFRVHNTNPEGVSGVMFYSSNDGTVSGLVANSEQFELAKNNDMVVETITVPLTRPVRGNDMMLALTSRVRSGTLYIKGIRVYGMFVQGDRFYYEYIFNKE